ncbi:MAG TPA: hypothetical protein VFV84_07960, partial [Burkholderiales bacterium]|nr:hypothetical protein [Burkholderiales bacterium]
IVEPTLTDMTGHCYSFLDAITRVSGDCPITLWGGRDAPVSFPSNVAVRGFFGRRLRRLQAWGLYRSLLRGAGRIFVSTAGRADLMLLDWASHGRIAPRKVFLYVHWFRASASKLRTLSRLAARQPEIVILAPTREVVDLFRAAGFRESHLVPYPMSPANPASPGGSSVFRHVLYAGAARRDKGFPEVVDYVQLLASRGEDTPVVLQTSAQHYDKTDPETAGSLRRLDSIGYAHLQRVPRTLGTDQYAALFSGAISLQLYLREDFADRVSGVTLDAFCNGCPIVTLTGTWMARLAQEFGAGEALDEPSPEAVHAAVAKIRGAYAHYYERAREAGRELRRRHDPARLFAAVTT